MNRHTLVIGGARSGKSRHAEALARATGLERVYLATATAWDDEMRERIALHRGSRAADGWRTVEEPLALAGALRREAGPGRVVLVDCLTLWLTNVMLGVPPEAGPGAARAAVEAASADLAGALPGLAGPAILVSNEVGWGIVPDNRLARDFRDAQGRLNQRMADLCGRVVLVAAGLPLALKGGPRRRGRIRVLPDTGRPSKVDDGTRTGPSTCHDRGDPGSRLRGLGRQDQGDETT